MSDPFIGQISTFGFAFAPRFWAACNGQILAIQQNTALFSLLGNAFGGSSPNTFGLPDLRGRTPLHLSQVYPTQGSAGGAESVTLTQNNMPMHTHTVAASNEVANFALPKDNFFFAQVPTGKPPAYAPYNAGTTAVMGVQSISPTGGGMAHFNIQPSLAINFCIALAGMYPSRN